MIKLRIGLLAFVALAAMPVAVGNAAILGPASGVCVAGATPSVLVRVSGLRSRLGTVRVRTFAGTPDTYFDKTKYQRRVEVSIPKAGPVDICVPVNAPGVYAVDVRHDANNNGDTDRADGAGASGNPKLTLFDVLFKRRPPAKQVQFSVGRGTTVVPIVLKYL
jgi:uncharacterized protein (DUF2141 family)